MDKIGPELNCQKSVEIQKVAKNHFVEMTLPKKVSKNGSYLVPKFNLVCNFR